MSRHVWEQAYRLKSQNRRPPAVAGLYKVIHWTEVARRLAAAKG
jgi:superoxide dismutase